MTDFPFQEFDRLTASFEAVAKLKSPVKQRFWLIWLAPYFGLPRAEIRKLFELWLIEHSGGVE